MTSGQTDAETPASRAAGRSLSRALQTLLDQARAAGCTDPRLFFEADSQAVFVLDGSRSEKTIAERIDAIVLRATIGVPFDTGAW